MVVLPARFGKCQRCGRLIAIGGVNPGGNCTKECGGSVRELMIDDQDRTSENPWLDIELQLATSPIGEPHWTAVMATAHHCPDPTNCSFGGRGCRNERGELIEGVEPA